MKVLGIMGSPRIKSNTDLLLDEALKGAASAGAEVEKLVIDRLNITACKEIYQCSKDGTCPLRDDMTGLYDKILEADAVIAASPIFFYTVSAQMMQFISRCQALWARRYILKNLDIPLKKGAFIGVGATKGSRLFDGAKLTMKYFFDAINAEYTGELLIRSVDKKGEILDHPTALADAFTLGKNLVSG
ncbi:MAG: flavodoxin family protein [Dehalococcoidales bacterium]|nr:flavodoxin family protein [Dehalococcoidales bacterium]